jgi:hypothetical protein
MSDQRHIHDPVLSSLEMEGIRLLFFINLLGLKQQDKCAAYQHSDIYPFLEKKCS